MQQNDDPPSKMTEVSNQKDYSANGLNNGQAEQEQEIESQHGHYDDKTKQTCKTFSEDIDIDLNSANTHQMTPQRTVQLSDQIQDQ